MQGTVMGDVYWQTAPMNFRRLPSQLVKERNIKLVGCLLNPAVEVGTVRNSGEDFYVFRPKGAWLWNAHSEIIAQVAHCDESLVCWPPKK